MESEHALRLIHLLPEPMFLIGADGTVHAGNPAAGDLYGEPGGIREGARLTERVIDPADKVERYLALCSRSRESMPGSLTWRASDGRHIETRCDAAVVRPRNASSPAQLLLRCRPKGETISPFSALNEKITALTREVLERRRAEQERDALLDSERAARIEAERISRMKDEFLTTLSHELRTPLNAIVGWCDILASASATPADTAEGVEVIQRNARSQARLVDDLLDMSRVISGKLRLDVQPVDLAGVIQAALDTIRPAADARNIRLQAILDPITGPVTGDPSRLQQVVWNLLSNAIKFTPKGGRVQVLLQRVNSHLEISVIDTGMGILPQFLPHVFDRFRQADSSTTRRQGGLGIGLSLVKQIVELHGGSVSARSDGEGRGATFAVVLPLTAAHFSKDEPERQHPTASEGPRNDCSHIDLKGVRVLVVDDEPDALRLIRRLLEECRAEVVTASSAAEAYDAITRGLAPHVLLSDVGMPGEDGYSLMRRIRARAPAEGGAVPSAALTAFARSEDRRRAMLAGFQVHVAKPVEPAELRAVVATLAGRTGRD